MSTFPLPALTSTRAGIVAATCACGLGSAFLFAVDPSRHAVYPTCLFHRATGLYCAGCGATRAAHALLHGRVLEALHDNVLFVSLLPIALAFGVLQTTRAWRDNAWPGFHFEQKLGWRGVLAAMLVLMAFTIARNLPGDAFAWLRPLS